MIACGENIQKPQSLTLNPRLRFFFKISALTHFLLYWHLPSCKISENTNERSLRYLKTDRPRNTNRRTGRSDNKIRKIMDNKKFLMSKIIFVNLLLMKKRQLSLDSFCPDLFILVRPLQFKIKTNIIYDWSPITIVMLCYFNNCYLYSIL